MLWGAGRPVRIPPPPRRAGFKRKAGYYHSGRGRLPENLPANLRLRGKPRTRALRREMRREAGLYRSPIRWALLLGTWAVLGHAALSHPYTRMSVLHFLLGLSAVTALPATFAVQPTTRAVLSIALLAMTFLGLLAGYPTPVAVLTGTSATLLFVSSIPRRNGREDARHRDPDETAM